MTSNGEFQAPAEGGGPKFKSPSGLVRSSSVALNKSSKSSFLNTLAHSIAVGEPFRGSALASTRARITASSFLNIAPASGDCPRSLQILGSPPFAWRVRTSEACPLYAASMSNVLPFEFVRLTGNPASMYAFRVVSSPFLARSKHFAAKSNVSWGSSETLFGFGISAGAPVTIFSFV